MRRLRNGLARLPLCRLDVVARRSMGWSATAGCGEQGFWGDRVMYKAYALARRGVRPVSRVLEVGHRLARSPSNPWRQSVVSRVIAMACELPLRQFKDYPKNPFRVRGIVDGEEVVLDPRVVHHLPFADLVGFSVEDAATKPKVLIAAALSGHHATLLEDTVRGFARDFDPYITDWQDARQVPLEAGDFGLDDYIAYLIEFLTVLGPGVHLVATCQAAPPALVAVAVLARDRPDLLPASLTLMAGPVDTRVNPAVLNKITERVPLSVFARNNIQTVPAGYPGTGRRVYPGFYQLSGFVLMNLRPHIRKYASFVREAIRGGDEETEEFRKFYDEYLSVLDVTESFYIETLRKIFFEHHIPTGRMTFRGEPVDFSHIRDVALMTIEGTNDGFCPPGQTEAAHGICPNISDALRAHHLQAGVGHYGIFSGSRFQNEVYPLARDFIFANSRGMAVP